MIKPSILCPVDFSEASRGALRYGAVLAEHFGSELVVMTATDPLLAEAAAMETSAADVTASTLDALRRFFSETIERCLKATPVAFVASVGKPEAEILRIARARRLELIVISSHGLTGFRKMFFGSTTERVLRETSVPVLVVPGDDRGPLSLADATSRVRRILAPVLLSPINARQIAVAKGLAEALPAPALLLHVVEPLRAVLPRSDRYLAKVERERRARAESELERIAGGAGPARVEALIAYGEPSEEIVKVARDRNAGLIVMALQGSPASGPRIGSVTYRVLCAAGRPVLALPAFARRASAGRPPLNFSPAAKKPAPPTRRRKAK
ncbi:MAG TPA: universal stress protein [Vicinamibacterales bacterium]|nr:universal stress protein [Vicinamibacterales bacterium]